MPVLPHHSREFDACAVYAALLKDPKKPGKVPVWHSALEALAAMEHRSGQLAGQSDGTGIITSLPKTLWERRLRELGIPVDWEKLWFVSLVLPVADDRKAVEVLKPILLREGLRFVAGYWDVVDGGEGIWSAVCLADGPLRDVGFQALEHLEEAFPGQVAVFGRDLATMKMRADARTVAEHAYKLWTESFHPRVVVAHNRFSTNTTTELRRVQPFMWLAHNGEINTIARLRRELQGLQIDALQEGSDSQTLDRALIQLSTRYGLSLPETLRLLSAPSPAVVETWPVEWRTAYEALETFWNPVVQGPQALIATNGRELAAAVDAMGLRPLWVVETEDQIILSSEVGVIEPRLWVAEPRMIGPGEVVGWTWQEDGPVTTVSMEEITGSLLARIKSSSPPVSFASGGDGPAVSELPTWQLAADGWTRDDLLMVKSWVQTGHEPITSLGFDGPLAALAKGIVPISDYLHETVAVVTNPALDREREGEHFRLHTWLGARPETPGGPVAGPSVRLDHPWLADDDVEAIMSQFGSRAKSIPLRWEAQISELAGVQAVVEQALAFAKEGVQLLLLTDQDGYQEGEAVTLDPVLTVSAVEQALLQGGWARDTSIIIRSGMIRNLHDAVVLLGMGARALVPHALWGQAGQPLPITVLNNGLEKIMSTMGTHWLAGYGRNFSAIGLPREVAEILGVETWAPPSLTTWERKRAAVLHDRLTAIQGNAHPRYTTRFNPHVYKAAQQMVRGEIEVEQYHETMLELERKMPIQLRHSLVVPHQEPRFSGKVSLKVGQHDYPFVISSMSFGSQGETSYRAYANAAARLNILAMNGEGGEIPDMIGKYTPWRGFQIASGRFGVNATLLNGANYAEIKIGQGAKPGEGGHLPGKKVSEKVARARNAKPGIDLISPSNNHDLYSIEDLRQLIDELKAVNPNLKVVVKVPVVPNIGTIAVGIVKAGADVVALSGFDGGTGAARIHALRYAGLPSDVGIPLVHNALLQAGVRDQVEIWADGGVHSADDVIKFILLGANRVGFGTMAMVALGCTICRQCQMDTCHVGITTQIETVEEARERGLKRFVPQEAHRASDNLVTFFLCLGEALETRLRWLGVSTVEEAVGKWQWLRQWNEQENVDYMDWVASLAEESEVLMVSEASGVAESTVVHYSPEPVRAPVAFNASDRRLAGVRQSGRRAAKPDGEQAEIVVRGVAGQGFGAFLSPGVTCLALGGAQDGAGKGASGGHIGIMKNGRYGGHVGKSLAYGAQGGVIVVQGAADSRAGVRLGGARVIIMGDGLLNPCDSRSWWDTAAIKGFGFEYMTQGEVLVLADPGPWLAAGMTGGTIYLRHDESVGLTQEFLSSRLSRSAHVVIQELDPKDYEPIAGLLNEAVSALMASDQKARADEIAALAGNIPGSFLKVVAALEQLDQDVVTE